MSGPYRLIVTDTSPLFTLVLADSLDVLLRPGLPISIPDAVYIEATRVRGAPGADRIVEWINDHIDTVRIIPTDIGIDQQRRLEEGRSIRGLGEQAAIEALERFLRSDAEARALLLFEDTDIERRRAVVGERVDLISTGDFLGELESARLIQSSDYILDRAAAQGRNGERQRQAVSDLETRERLQDHLRRKSAAKSLKKLTRVNLCATSSGLCRERSRYRLPSLSRASTPSAGSGHDRAAARTSAR